jgi:hypothetical protein
VSLNGNWRWHQTLEVLLFVLKKGPAESLIAACWTIA